MTPDKRKTTMCKNQINIKKLNKIPCIQLIGGKPYSEWPIKTWFVYVDILGSLGMYEIEARLPEEAQAKARDLCWYAVILKVSGKKLTEKQIKNL
jgi:hypothetical protein